MTEDAAAPKAPSKTFYRIRVAILLMILAGVSLYAWNDYHRRHERTEWKRPLLIAFVVVREGPVTKDAVDALRAHAPALEKKLESEMRRYMKSGPDEPFKVTIFGPVEGAEPPPKPPDQPGLVATPLYQLHLDRWVSKVDDLASLPSAGFDSRVYLYARPPENAKHKSIEGASELGGRVGIVRVELDASMADFTLFVATHEMLHTLGATDKYDADGNPIVPDGLAEPDQHPPYPQRFAEIMARHRPINPVETKPPASLDELAVGAKTAAEIGWVR